VERLYVRTWRDRMRKIIYLMNVSLDGFVEGPDGRFGWSRPDEEVHRFHNEIARETSAFLYGRRMYETMAVWQTLDEDHSLPDYVVEFARIWRATPKIVFSSTLGTVGGNCRLVRGDAAAELTSLKQQPGGDLAVSGPGLASTLARLGMVDEYRLVVYPVIVGGGKPYFPVLDQPVSLRLIETRAFRGGAVYLRYRRAG
jgi:dihydrofolate reductase